MGRDALIAEAIARIEEINEAYELACEILDDTDLAIRIQDAMALTDDLKDCLKST